MYTDIGFAHSLVEIEMLGWTKGLLIASASLMYAGYPHDPYA
jgi:hypothetical protein